MKIRKEGLSMPLSYPVVECVCPRFVGQPFGSRQLTFPNALGNLCQRVS